MSDQQNNETTEDEKPEGSAAEGESTDEAPEGDEGADETNKDESSEGNTEDGDNEEKLTPEQLRKALTTARSEAANYRVKLREAKEKLESAKTPEEVAEATAALTARINELERSVLVTNVAQGLDADQTAIITALAEAGKTEDELKAHAATLKKHAVPEVEHLDGGLDPTDDDDDSNDPAVLARRYGRGRNKKP